MGENATKKVNRCNNNYFPYSFFFWGHFYIYAHINWVETRAGRSHCPIPVGAKRCICSSSFTGYGFMLINICQLSFWGHEIQSRFQVTNGSVKWGRVEETRHIILQAAELWSLMHSLFDVIDNTHDIPSQLDKLPCPCIFNNITCRSRIYLTFLSI